MQDDNQSNVLRSVLANYSSQYHPMQYVPINQAGFSGARVWKATTAVGEFAVRQWPAEGLHSDRLLGLHQLLHHLRDQHITLVAPPVTAASGTTLVDVSNHLWQLEPWMPGSADYHNQPSEAKLSAAMRALAGWHRAAATFRPSKNHQQWFASHNSATSPGIAERLRLVFKWNSQHLDMIARAVGGHAWPEFRDVAFSLISAFKGIAPCVADELRMAASIHFRLQPCLRDVWHDHILFIGDEVAGIIDPSACRSETVAGDIARLVGSLVGDDRHGWETALTAYQTVCRLSIDERAAVELFDRSGVLLSGMTWVQWIAIEGRPVDDRERVLARMTAILTRLQNMGG